MITPGQTGSLEEGFLASIGADLLLSNIASPVGWYGRGYDAGKAAVTINAFGDGQVIYLGMMINTAYDTAASR